LKSCADVRLADETFEEAFRVAGVVSSGGGPLSDWSNRGRRARLGISVLSALVVWFSLAGIAAAQTFTLSGAVTGGGFPIAGATVEALTNGTTTVAGSSTTNGSGQFSIVLSPAVYDLRVTPPAASGFGTEILQDIDLTTSNQQVDVVLLSSAPSSTISGTVLGLNGAPIPSANVSVTSQSTGQSLGNAVTDANGFYSLTVSGTVVRVNVSRSGPTPSAPSGSWNVQRSSVSLSPNTTCDFNLPVVTLSGTVTDNGGNPVGSGTVSASGSGSDSMPRNWSYSGVGTANAAGAYSMTIFTSPSTSFTVRPPAGSPLPLLVQNSVSITADTVRDFALPASSSLSGVVFGYGAQPVSGVSISARSTVTGTTLASTFTAADGSYTLSVPTGNVNLVLSRGSAPSTLAPTSWSLTRNNVAVSGSTTLNLQLPVVSMHGVVTDPASTPVSNASISADSSGSDSQGSWSSSFSQATGDGTYNILLFSGSANLFVRPPTGSTVLAALVDRGFPLTADVTRTLILPTALSLSGIVRGIGGQPLQGASVSARHSSGLTLLSTTTDANGAYSLALPSGTLSDVTFSRGSSSAALAPTGWTYRRFSVPVTGPTTLDVSLNVIRLNGSASDSNGAPVPNVLIAPSTNRFQTGGDLTEWFSNSTVNTDSAGAYSILLLTGTTGSILIRPQTNSGFSQVTLNSVVFANNFTQRIVLQRPDTTPPVIVSGPGVLHLSDSSVSIGWTTNEPATSFVDYGIGGFTQQAGSSALVTQHTVTLQGLTPHEIYSFRVFSRDRNNNGPTQSGTDFFTMLAPPGDVTPPAITGGPVAAFLGDTSAIVQWLTDEPSSSLVRFGTTPSFGSQVASNPGDFLALHATLLPGLTPSTDYFAQVESTDPDGNTVVSSTFTFTTAAAPDIQPPVITSTPVVSSRTHNAATIRWTTNEAATSGVSYNDGTAFNVTSSDSLTTTHELILAGLSPSRTYNFTVASKDAAGNGPTLMGPFSFTTLAAPDVNPPVISGVNVTPTKNTAAVAWTTDEPATTVVRFGTVSGALDRIVSDLSTQTSHLATLTGLLPGTTYFYSLRSTDATGNTTNTPEGSFLTLPEDVNVPPTPPGPVTASPNPGNTGSFTITWGASTDDGPGGVKEYVVLLNGNPVDTLPATATSYLVTGAPEGSHTYRIRASDFSDATSLSDPIIVVVDLTAPSLNLPAPITTPATTNTDAIVNYSVTSTDNRDPNPVVSCAPASGSAFTIGTTTVPCTARDAAGNVTPGSFTVTVTDPFAPILTVPANISVQADNQNGAVVNFTATATDNHDPNPVVVCTPPSGSVFPVGFTPTSCTATDASGNSSTRTFTVSVGAPPKVASAIVLQSSSPGSTYGQPVTFTATVSGTNGSAPTGTVTFYVDGATAIGQGTLGSGSPITATLTIATLAAGSRSITASYAGDFGHEPSTSTALALEIAKAAPTISGVGGTFPYDGGPHAAAGNVTGTDGASIGTLTFTYDGSTSVPVAAGSYAVVASFAGNDNYDPGSANGTLTIVPGATQTVVQAGPATVFGQTASIAAAVTSPLGETPQGSVEFFDGVTSLATAALNAGGVAQMSTASLAVGRHTLTAVYSGGGNFGGGVSAPVLFDVSVASTGTTVSVVPNPSGLLEAFRVTATIAVLAPGAGVPNGIVEFFAGGVPLGSAPVTLVGGVPTAVTAMNGFPAGSYAITARYTGNTSFAPSTSPAVDQVVRGAESSTWTVLSASPSLISRAGAAVTLRAAVVPLGGTVQPTGLVQFYAWSTPIGAPVAVVNVGGTMVATLVTSALPSGLVQLRAQYLGNAGFSTSISPPISHTVYASTAPATSATSITLSGNPITFGTTLTVTASVASGTRPTPGFFLLMVDGVPTQAVAVVSGSPSVFSVPSPGRGLHGITVQFIPSTTTLAGSLMHVLVLVQ
jgi:hypothetical protein